MIFRKMSVSICLMLLGAGCSGPAAIRMAETNASYVTEEHAGSLRTVQFNPEESLQTAILYSKKLSEAYINHSDNVSLVQDAAALTVIGATTVAASAVLFDLSPDVLSTAGLVAGTTAGLWNYSKPGSQRQLALKAAEKMACIADAGSFFVVNTIIPSQTDNENAKLIVLSGIQSVRIDLRRGFTAELPSFEALVGQILKNANVDPPNDADIGSNAAEQLKVLQASVVACRALAGA